MAEERQAAWTISITEFDMFVPAWFKNAYPFYGNKEMASDMKNVDLMDPNVMTQGPAPTNLTNNSVVTTVARSFLTQATGADISFAIGGNKLYKLSSSTITNDATFPHTIDKAAVTAEDGEDMCYYKTNLYYFYNHSGSAGDIGKYNMATTFDDDWGSTVPTGMGTLQNAPHQAINGGDDVMYFTNGIYIGTVSGTTLETQALDFWTDSVCSSITWNADQVWIAVNRPNLTGANLTQSSIYSWDGFAPSWNPNPISVNGRIGALYTKDGTVFVWWQDAGTTTDFNFGYVSGPQVKILRKCKGTLPLFYQVGEYKGYVAWISDGLAYLYGSADPDAPIKFFQYTSAKYTTSVGGIGFQLGQFMTSSNDGGSNYSVAKASGYTVDSLWKTRAFPVTVPGFVSVVDKIQVMTEQMATGAKADFTLTYDNAKSSVALDQIAYSSANKTFHKILNKAPKLEDFRLDVSFANGSATNPVKIRNIFIMGHYVPEN